MEVYKEAGAMSGSWIPRTIDVIVLVQTRVLGRLAYLLDWFRSQRLKLIGFI
jgi:hypothetical protein